MNTHNNVTWYQKFWSKPQNKRLKQSVNHQKLKQSLEKRNKCRVKDFLRMMTANFTFYLAAITKFGCFTCFYLSGYFIKLFVSKTCQLPDFLIISDDRFIYFQKQSVSVYSIIIAFYSLVKTLFRLMLSDKDKVK